MEDLTEEAKQEEEGDQTKSIEMGSEGEDGEEEKGEKAENNSCISIYFQSKKHDLKVRNLSK